MVVEDDADLREVYRIALTLAGYIVVAVEDGIDALRRIETGLVPHLMVLDRGLPRLAGHDVQREIASNPETRDLPIVLVTGDTRGVDPKAFSCVLRKPISTDDLIAAVRRCLGQNP